MHKQLKTTRVVIRVEPVIATAMGQLVNSLNLSQSDYVRKLILADLKLKGLLTDTMIHSLL